MTNLIVDQRGSLCGVREYASASPLDLLDLDKKSSFLNWKPSSAQNSFLDGHCISPSIIRLRGYTAEEALSQTLEQTMTPESLQIAVKAFEEEMTLEASGTADPARTRILEL